MTTVIALRTTENSFILGSDSYCGDDEISLSCGPKFFEDDEIIWGLCGYTLYENELMNAVQNVRESVIWRGNPSKFTVATTVIKKFKSELEQKSLLIDKDGFKEMKSSNFFFIAEGEMYYLDEDLSYWKTTNDFMAIGCGKQFALGSLETTDNRDNKKPVTYTSRLRVQMALEAATKFSPFVREPFHIEEFKF